MVCVQLLILDWTFSDNGMQQRHNRIPARGYSELAILPTTLRLIHPALAINLRNHRYLPLYQFYQLPGPLYPCLDQEQRLAAGHAACAVRNVTKTNRLALTAHREI